MTSVMIAIVKYMYCTVLKKSTFCRCSVKNNQKRAFYSSKRSKELLLGAGCEPSAIEGFCKIPVRTKIEATPARSRPNPAENGVGGVFWVLAGEFPFSSAGRGSELPARFLLRKGFFARQRTAPINATLPHRCVPAKPSLVIMSNFLLFHECYFSPVPRCQACFSKKTQLQRFLTPFLFWVEGSSHQCSQRTIFSIAEFLRCHPS